MTTLEIPKYREWLENRRKLANPAIRRIFPWWWWCCDDPNICFTVTQGGNTVLNEDPATRGFDLSPRRVGPSAAPLG